MQNYNYCVGHQINLLSHLWDLEEPINEQMGLPGGSLIVDLQGCQQGNISNKNNMISEQTNRTADRSLHREINDLRSMVQRAVNENQRIFQKARQLEPTFSHSFYQPKQHSGENLFFLKAVLMKQMDSLQEERDLLLKKREEMEFRIQSQKERQELEFNKNINHYSLLRFVWTKIPKREHSNSEKIDSLNKVVNMVRANLKALTTQERQIVEDDLAWGQQELSARQRKLKQQEVQKIERLKMENQQLKTRYVQLSKIDAEKTAKITQLQEELTSAGGKIKKCLQTLDKTTEKIKHLQEVKKLLEDQLMRLREQNSTKERSLCFYGQELEKFKVTITSEHLNQQEESLITHQKLNDVISYLNTQPIDQARLEIIKKLPALHIDFSSEKNLHKGFTERYEGPRTQKFIPIRTQRNLVNKSSTNKTTTDSQQKYEIECEEQGRSNKKFQRKGDCPVRFNSRSKFPKKDEILLGD